MLETEWLEIGYDKGIIDKVPEEESVAFEEVYHMWFKAKLSCIRPQSTDRIENTWVKYYEGREFSRMYVHQITDSIIKDFINDIILSRGNITKKEYGRIYSIVHGVMCYAKDLKIGHCKVIDWDVVKRYVAFENVLHPRKPERTIKLSDIRHIMQSVLVDRIYPLKQSACLAICLNFYLGLRIGELASVKWSDIDYAERQLYVHSSQVKSFERDEDGNRTGVILHRYQDETKTEHGTRILPLVNEAVFILEVLRNHHKAMNYDSEFICYDGTDTILSKSLARTVKRLCVLCDCPEFNSHLIRKTFATTLCENLVPLNIVSELLGHADVITTQRFYIIANGNDIKYRRDLLQKALRIEL